MGGIYNDDRVRGRDILLFLSGLGRLGAYSEVYDPWVEISRDTATYKSIGRPVLIFLCDWVVGGLWTGVILKCM